MSDKLPVIEAETDNVPGNAGEDLSLGQILRTARLEKTSSSIEEIASEIRIRPHLLEALENDNFGAFPGFVYAVGFLRSYASYLGLDARDLTERLRKSHFAPRQDSALVFPQPIEDSRMPKRWLAVAASVLCLGVYGVWYGIAAVGEVGLDRVPEVSKVLVQGVLEPVHPAAQPAAGTESPAAQAQSLTLPAAKVQKLSLPASTVQTPAERAVEKAPQNAKAVKDDAGKNDQGPVTLRAKSDAWVRIEGPNSEPIIDRVLRAGEAYDAPARPGLVLITGNAGALDVTVGGHNLGALGPEGAIRRDIALNARSLREYTQ